MAPSNSRWPAHGQWRPSRFSWESPPLAMIDSGLRATGHGLRLDALFVTLRREVQLEHHDECGGQEQLAEQSRENRQETELAEIGQAGRAGDRHDAEAEAEHERCEHDAL